MRGGWRDAGTRGDDFANGVYESVALVLGLIVFGTRIEWNVVGTERNSRIVPTQARHLCGVVEVYRGRVQTITVAALCMQVAFTQCSGRMETDGAVTVKYFGRL